MVLLCYNVLHYTFFEVKTYCQLCASSLLTVFLCFLFFLQGPTLISPFGWYMERGPPIPNDVMTMKPSHLTANQIVAEAQSLLLQKQPPDLTDSLKPKKKKRKVPSENGETLPTVGVGGGKGCSRRPARIRTSFTNDQIQELEAHFLRCMYPRSTEIQRISSQLQLTENIVQASTVH